MAIQRFEPLRELVSLQDAMSALLQESFLRPTSLTGGSRGAPLPLDIVETEDEFIVRASLPGVRPEDVHITAHGDMLTIWGEIKAEAEKKDEHYHIRERRYGRFQRTVTLSAPIDASKAQAGFENGVLTLRLPKSAEAKPRQIKIEAPSASQAPASAPAQTTTRS